MNNNEIKTVDKDELEKLKFLKATNNREQAAVTVGRDVNSDFISFKNSFLDNLKLVKEHLSSIFTSPTIDIDELYDSSLFIFSNMDNQMDAILYLNAMYSSDYYIIEHCLRVGILANIFARWLDYDEKMIKIATVSGFLHDIGMLEVPKEIIEKEGTLTRREFDLINEHPGRGSFMAMSKGVDEEIVDAIRSHHERFDGSGYPRGTSGDEVGKMASLIGIVDVYDSMTSNRPYSLPKCPFDVINILEFDMINKFNPAMLYVFLENIPYMYKNVLVKLSDESEARVVFINKNNKTSPIVQLEDSKDFIDLSMRRDLKIVSLL